MEVIEIPADTREVDHVGLGDGSPRRSEVVADFDCIELAGHLTGPHKRPWHDASVAGRVGTAAFAPAGPGTVGRYYC
ncbi:hypothetical protein GCM10009067_02850 [Haloarcula sebkhae]|uniref:Uncharacterized protein n=1 Tax=Haloarcula sebkhae TaxID=932660 RepID=A0A830EX93_9EURY|nr:hypothetical protein GCM10009067_02850 [Haloarcula sebkhae]